MEPRYEILIESLMKSGYLRTPEIATAMKATDRAGFIPSESASQVYEDRPIMIGCDQVSSQPLVVAFMLELLSPKSGDKILDVGTGSGWSAAILSKVVGTTGKVVTVERASELHELAKKNISASGVSLGDSFEMVLGDAGSEAILRDRIFDGIISGAEAETIPEVWKRALSVGGRMVVPVRGSIIVAEKVSANEFKFKEFPGFGFTPLMTGKIK